MKPWRLSSLGSLLDKKRKPLVISFLLLALSLFIMVGVIIYIARDKPEPTRLIHYLIAWIGDFFGLAATLFGCLLALIWSSWCFLSGSIPRVSVKFVGIAGVIVSVSGLTGAVSFGEASGQGTGILGQTIASAMVPLFSMAGSLVLFSALLVGSLLLATNWFFYEEFRRMTQTKATTSDPVKSLDDKRDVQMRTGPPRDELALSIDEQAAIVEQKEPAIEEDTPEAEIDTVEPVYAKAEESSVEQGEEKEEEEPIEDSTGPGLGFLFKELEKEEERVEEQPEPSHSEEKEVTLPRAEQDSSEREIEIPRPEKIHLPSPGEASPESGVSPQLVDQAAGLVIETNRASTTLLQRRLKVTFAAASKIMEELEALQVIGPYRGSLAREVLITSEEWDSIKTGESKG